MRSALFFSLLFVVKALLPCAWAFSVSPGTRHAVGSSKSSLLVASETSDSTAADSDSLLDDSDNDTDDLVAKRIVVSGDVDGGYVRACVINEAGRFRRLVGTMTDPDTSSDKAEIYVEGKRNMVDGFIRWCERGKVGLSQTLQVLEVIDEEPTGLYESFYCKTKDT